eukprot:snap_masked-scaffold_10-processed-gene-10.26-mRNA-1 protein AED:0.22 eAED:0.22 QI:0/0/0/0.33/1/1/3/0/519
MAYYQSAKKNSSNKRTGMKATHVIFCRNKRPEFWFEEIQSLQDLHGISNIYIDVEKQTEQTLSSKGRYDTIIFACFPDDEAAKVFAERSVMIHFIVKLYIYSNNLSSLLENICSVADLSVKKTDSWRLDVESLNNSISFEEQNEFREKVLNCINKNLFSGKINLARNLSYCSENYNQFSLILQYEKKAKSKEVKPNIEQAIFGKIVGQGMKKTLAEFSLKSRVFLGPTSTEAELAFLMANQGRISIGKKVFDPFVGTGSILLSASKLGAICFGSDIDTRILRGKQKNIFDNFKQYNLQKPEIFRMDFSPRGICLKYDSFFDAIICDPPYGIRAGARKSTSKDETYTKKLQEHPNKHIVQTAPYAPEDLLPELVDSAARLLTIGGYLVYLLPVNVQNYSDNILPKHKCLKLISNSEDCLTTKYSRRLITMKKIREHESDEENLKRNKKVLKEVNEISGQDKHKIQPVNGKIILDRRERRKARKLLVKQFKQAKKESVRNKLFMCFSLEGIDSLNTHFVLS